MEEKNMIPFFVHESALARAERTAKRLFILCLVLIAVAVITNVMWILYERQFEEFETTEITQDAEWDSGDVIMNGTGEINYGESTSDSQSD